MRPRALGTAARRSAVLPAAARLLASSELDTEAEIKSASEAFSTFTRGGRELPLQTKEKLYLDSIAAFYNDDEPLLSDEDYARLKLDLEFEASKYITMSAEELKFVIASTRFREAKPIMSDDEYDELRRKLKKANSPAVIHDAPQCKVETGLCKSDATPDQGKNAILYLPGALAATLLWAEGLFWVKGFDPLFSIVLGSPVIYLIARLITEKILFQNPLVVSATCPNCSSVINLYFGDVLGVDNENMMQTEHECPVCKAKLRGSRETMIVETIVPKA
eukprot:CAMPEP_0119414378 /NCGR_PEP_ID=MMETSP1335-20130426/6878_1 /TAXON_ID=259385 /ORGANISM="Chrysoculter rhomboideus, Strain RCC1486" /LENGTH=276 /DNA_ID=CAMNT_0007439257 /DNA_START=98 /DNA_END=928 /DNA_ORIENTATION=+